MRVGDPIVYHMLMVVFTSLVANTCGDFENIILIDCIATFLVFFLNLFLPCIIYNVINI